MVKKLIHNIKPEMVYFIISYLGIFLFLYAVVTKGIIVFDWIAMENNSDWAMLDYFRHIFFASDLTKVYEYGFEASFPPLAYLFYHLIGEASIADMSTVAWYDGMPALPYQIIIFVMYTIFGVMLIYGAIDEMCITKKAKYSLFLSVLCSTPMFMGAIERGNLALYVAGMMMFAVLWRNSGNRIKKELALVLIAVAAGLKIYPAFLGILYLKEKRWGEAARLVLYGIICFFLPFVLCGGIHGMQLFLNNIFVMNTESYAYRVQFFQGLLGFWGIYGINAQILNYIFLLSLFILIFISKSDIRIMTYLAASMAFFPSGAFRYTLIYFLLPLLFLFVGNDSKVNRYLSAVGLGLLFSIPSVFGYFTHFNLNFGSYTYTYVERCIYTVAWAYLGIQILMECRENINKVRNARK